MAEAKHRQDIEAEAKDGAVGYLVTWHHLTCLICLCHESSNAHWYQTLTLHLIFLNSSTQLQFGVCASLTRIQFVSVTLDFTATKFRDLALSTCHLFWKRPDISFSWDILRFQSDCGRAIQTWSRLVWKELMDMEVAAEAKHGIEQLLSDSLKTMLLRFAQICSDSGTPQDWSVETREDAWRPPSEMCTNRILKIFKTNLTYIKEC